MSPALLAVAASLFGALPADAPTAPARSGLTIAGAPSAAKAALMETAIREYLLEERLESKIFVGIGALAIAGGIAMLLGGSAFYKGAALPLMAVALIQIGVGGAVWWRTEEHIASLVALLHSDGARFLVDETARMAVVNRNFNIYKVIEIALAMVGVGLVADGFALKNDTMKGVGAGLALQAGLMLTFDLVAEARADRYTNQIALFAAR